jgi:hypothetical protein
MKIMKQLMNRQSVHLRIYTLLCVSASIFFSGCGDENKEPENQPEESSEYLYVLNNGSMGMNNASLTMYDVENKVVIQNYFEKQNGRGLGDTGQDILVYGSKIYISMTDENTIEITDLEAKSIKQIRTDGQPRYFAAYGGKVYVTYYNGYVARIDTVLLEVEKTARVGRNPEQLAVANRKLYVANSGGLDFPNFDKTVSVIDITSFTETKKIEVVINPCNTVVDNKENVYVVSIGNYADVPNTIQKIDSKTDAVSALDIKGTYVTLHEDTLYMIHSEYDEKGDQKINYYSYDIVNNRIISDHFIGNTVFSANPYGMCPDNASGEIYITVSDYINTGDVYVFDKRGDFLYSFEAGLNPIKVVKIRK